MDVLFVYGTLRSEFDNQYAKLLRSQSAPIGPAVVPGSIFRIAHYPGYRPMPAGTVHGELYRLLNPAATLKLLDEYEGAEYERVMVADRWIYQYQKQPADDTRILSGDFCRP